MQKYAPQSSPLYRILNLAIVDMSLINAAIAIPHNVYNTTDGIINLTIAEFLHAATLEMNNILTAGDDVLSSNTSPKVIHRALNGYDDKPPTLIVGLLTKF